MMEKSLHYWELVTIDGVVVGFEDSLERKFVGRLDPFITFAILLINVVLLLLKK